MQRPSASRRVGAGAVDRPIAIVAFCLAAIGLVCGAAFARAPVPETHASALTSPANDPASARDLIALMRAGERGHWIVEYDFTRRRADGRVLRQQGEEGRSGAWRVVITGTAMTIEHGDATSSCDLVGAEYGCQKAPARRSLAGSRVVRVVVDAGAYSVSRRPDITIAGIRAQCFRMRATGQGSLYDFGVQTEVCMSREGIPLQLSVLRPPADLQTQRTTSVRRSATPARVAMQLG